MAESTWVIDVTAATFQEQIVERSKQVPVVVDFWAPWCGPCRALGPLLESLANEKPGRFLLAKVNTDENQEIAQAFQIEGIPAVFAIKDGKVVDQFTGMLPEAEVRTFLDRITGNAPPDPLAQALELEGRDPTRAAAAYREMLKADANNAAARVGLARVLLQSLGSEAEAVNLLHGIDPGEHMTEIERLKTILKLREVPHTDEILGTMMADVNAKADDAGAKLEIGKVLAARGDYSAALEFLLAAADLDRTLGRGAVRELMVDIFNVIGPRSPMADDYRSRLQGMLY
jgi:putative thioredoxin